jgi:hypothetical protein
MKERERAKPGCDVAQMKKKHPVSHALPPQINDTAKQSNSLLPAFLPSPLP